MEELRAAVGGPHVRFAQRWLAVGSALVVGAGCASKSDPSARGPSLGVSQDPLPIAASESGEVASKLTELPIIREAWHYAGYDGQFISTPHFRLYTTVQSEDFLDLLPVFYERALKNYTSALTKLPQPQVPLETYLFQNRRQWQTKTEEMLPEQAGMFSNLGRGGFTTRGTSVLYYIDRTWGYPRDTFAIAAHEGWHQYTQQTFRHQLPVWLEEGVATYMEGYRLGPDDLPVFSAESNRERRETLRSAVRRNNLVTLNELLTRSPQSFLSVSKDRLLVYYAQVWALTRFLAEGENGRYRGALAELLADAAEGRLASRMMTSNNGRRRAPSDRVGLAVAREYFNRDLTQLEAQYMAFINEIVQSSPQRGPSGDRR